MAHGEHSTPGGRFPHVSPLQRGGHQRLGPTQAARPHPAPGGTDSHIIVSPCHWPPSSSCTRAEGEPSSGDGCSGPRGGPGTGQLQSPIEDPAAAAIWAGAGPVQPPSSTFPTGPHPITGSRGSQRVLEGCWPQGRHLGPCPVTPTRQCSHFPHSFCCVLPSRCDSKC